MRVGTVVSAVLLAVGVVLVALEIQRFGTALLAAGCTTLVLLPIARLVLMARHFARRDRLFMLISLVVLALVVAGAAVGLLTNPV